MIRELLILFLITVLTPLPTIAGTAHPQPQTYSVTPDNPLANFHGTGHKAPVYWAGSNERLNNTSFENGNTQPWVDLVYNSNGSTVQVVSPGYNSNMAARLSIKSGNVSIPSYNSLFQDFSQNPAGFGPSATVQAAVQVQTLSGNSSSDRTELTVTLASSIGNTLRLHYIFSSGLALIPTNTTTDAYFKVPSFGSPGWISINRNLATDAQAQFSILYPAIDAVRDVRLSVYAKSLSNATYDPRIKYVETGPVGDVYWNKTETIVYDSDQDGVYISGDRLLYNGTGPLPVSGVTALSNDRMIKYVDANLNGKWDPGESIVYDTFNEGVYDPFRDPPAMSGSTPVSGTLLVEPARRLTTALFDQIHLTTPSASQNWVINGSLEIGSLTGWGGGTTFTTSTSRPHTGAYSVYGSITNGDSQLAQSIDAAPRINSWTRLQAFANIATSTGTTSSDIVDLWLGLSDSQQNPVFLYYVFSTGNGTLPTDSKGVQYIKSPSFGTLQQWLSIDRSLAIDTSTFTLQGYRPPYSINLIVLDVAAQGVAATTSSYFDDISIQSPTLYTSLAAMNYYTVDGQNTTYAYTVSNIPSSSFSLQIPAGQSTLNTTSPSNTILQASAYNTTQVSSGLATVNIPDTIGSLYPVGSTWRVFTTSRNIVTSVYPVDPKTKTKGSSIGPGSTVDLAAQLTDPIGSMISNASVEFVLTNSKGTVVGNWPYAANGQGWFNATGALFPSATGTYTLQANATSFFYAGLKTTQVTVAASSYALLVYIAIAAAGVGVISLLLFRSKRRTTALKGQPAQEAIRNRGPRRGPASSGPRDMPRDPKKKDSASSSLRQLGTEARSQQRGDFLAFCSRIELKLLVPG
jgi:hypothetical protein